MNDFILILLGLVVLFVLAFIIYKLGEMKLKTKYPSIDHKALNSIFPGVALASYV